MKQVLLLEGLDCANCAAKIERAVKSMEGVSSASLSFLTGKLVIECADDRSDDVYKAACAVVRKLEPDVAVKRAR